MRGWLGLWQRMVELDVPLKAGDNTVCLLSRPVVRRK